MALLPRNYPLPRGDLSQGLGTFYANQVATAAARVTGNSGKFAQVGLFNNSTIGTLLYCIGLSVWNSDATGDVIMYILNATPPGATIVPGVSINPLMAQLDGQLLTTADGGAAGGSAIWRISGGGQAEDWIYGDPMIIIPPGYAFYTMPQHTASTVSAAFRWLVMKNQ